MVAFADLFIRPALAAAKASVLAISQAAGLSSTAFILGQPSERFIEIMGRIMDAWGTVPTQAVRGFFLDLATDPGDPGDLSADQTPRAGWLSALGEGWYGTVRFGRTYATTTVTVTNSGATPATSKPYSLTFTLDPLSTLRSDGGLPTYRNAPDTSIYTGTGGTLTLAPGASIAIPVACDQIGAYGNAVSGNPGDAGAITVVVSQSWDIGSGDLTLSGGGTAIGTERESPESYRARCRLRGAMQSPGGPGAAYVRASNTARDGSALQRHDGTGPVGITRTYVSPDSATSEVTVYYADDDGPATTVDVDTANANILGVSVGTLIDPIGVLPDAVLLLPYTYGGGEALPTGTPGGLAAIATTVTATGSVRIRAVRGVSNADLITAVKAAIVTALGTWMSTMPIGGLDQVAGAGSVYRADMSGIIQASYPGVYDVILNTLPTSWAIAAGHVPVLATSAGAWTVTVA